MQIPIFFPVVLPQQLVTHIGVAVILCITVAGNLSAAPKSDLPILVEAEGFANSGGWVVDPQFMDQMGSPYLLAHGLGVPVKDATTHINMSGI